MAYVLEVNSSRNRKSWKDFISLVAIPAVVALCLGSTGGAAQANELTIGVPNAIPCLDPACNNSQYERSVKSQLHLALTSVNQDEQLVPQLATSWENPAPTEWVFTLRDGVTFENGTPITAETVKANFDRYRDRSATAKIAGSWLADIQSSVASIEAIDDSTVKFTLTRPWTEFAARLASLPIIDLTWVAEGNDATKGANASGPYRLVSFDPTSAIVLEANPAYYGEPPAYSKVTYRVLTSPAARLTAAQAHEVDVVLALDPQDLAALKGDSALKVGAVESSRNYFIWYNTSRPPFDNQDIRLALNYAVNKAAITGSLMDGMTSPSKGQVLNEPYPGFNTDLKPFSFDKAKAKELLASGGQPNGFKMTLSYPSGAYPGIDLIVQAVAAQLGDVGVNVDLQPMTLANWVSMLQGDASKATDATVAALAPADTQDVGMLKFFASSYTMNKSIDPKYDELFAALLKAETQEEHAKIVKELTQRQHDNAQLLFLFPTPLTYAINKSVDMKIPSNGMIRAYDASPAK
nr:ABC transporter substrate-binding protein [Acuticoccus mangrovi]